MMVDMGHTIMIQRGAGEAAHYHDREYADAGAQMLDTCEEVYTADIILKPTPVMQADVEMMHDRRLYCHRSSFSSYEKRLLRR